MRLLTGTYLALSVATLIVAAVLSSDPTLVNDAVWIRGGILAVVSASAVAVAAAKGSRSGLMRVRILTAVQVVAIAVIRAVPGPFPLWLRIEQAVCGLLLLAVVVIVNRRPLR